MFNFFSKKTEEISRTTPGFEETERRTPKTGIILLIAMFIAGTWSGWYALNDLSRIPAAPQPISYCGQAYASNGMSQPISYYGQPYASSGMPELGTDPKCNFNDIEKKSSVLAIFQKKGPLEKEKGDIEAELNSVSSSLYNTQNQIKKLTVEYGVGLQEKETAVPAPVFQISSQQEQLAILKSQETNYLGKKSDLENKRNAVQAKLDTVNEELRNAYTPVSEKQNRLLRWYEFKVFLLQFLFIFPFFIFVFWKYLKLHRKNSPYTIIFTAMVGVASILLLKVISVWFWGLFLARALKVLLNWFGRFEILRSIVFYLGMLLSFFIFGGAAYWLQKRVFDPKRIILRRFRAKQCPNCQTNLDLAVSICPNCGTGIREKCAKCGQNRIIGLPFCPYCGDKKQ